MRVVVAMVVLVGVLTVLVGASVIRDDDEDQPDDVVATQTEAASISEPSGSGGGDPMPPEAPDPSDPEPVQVEHRDEINVQKPVYTNFTENITRVREHYAERHTYGTVTVAWRPGAFPVERAAEVADLTARLLGEANARLQTNFYPELEIFLADQLYTEECHGCQGFAAADLLQVFILQDGSLADDEFEALLIHEITHVIAAHEISLPHSLFFAEGLATWVMTDYLVESGYIPPVQVAAWAAQVGIMPSLEVLRDDGFDGRVRKRAEYDGAAAFAFFVIDTYGYEAYLDLYRLDPPEMVLGKTWGELDGEWRAYLSNWAGNTVNGVDAHQWWGIMNRVIDGFGTLYTDPTPVSAEQYRELVRARLAINRGDVATASAAIDASGLANRTAQ